MRMGSRSCAYPSVPGIRDDPVSTAARIVREIGLGAPSVDPDVLPVDGGRRAETAKHETPDPDYRV